jgi:exportin-7
MHYHSFILGLASDPFSPTFSLLSLLMVCLLLQVTTPLLKFMAEFVLNKAQRLTFDSSSPNGILLFREVSKLIVAYGSRILTLPNTADVYTYKYKGIWICLTILSRGEILPIGYFYLH